VPAKPAKRLKCGASIDRQALHKTRRIAVDERDLMPQEKWLVAFRDPKAKSQPEGRFIFRQFYAPGFYEAYDKVLTYAEKRNFDVMWFKEKRSCDACYINRTFPELELTCTYCNKRFSNMESIPCQIEECELEFCSKTCMLEHRTLRHKR
jgi:hypothetical protein